VERINGAIGYVDLQYAIQNKLRFGMIQNQSGVFVEASSSTVSAAAEGALAQIPDDFIYSVANAPGKNSYPISGTMWAVFYTNTARDREGVLVEFMRWAIREGQPVAAALNYAKLPSILVERILKKLEDISPEKHK
jgi:phosphate transport system substrate-binding protein